MDSVDLSALDIDGESFQRDPYLWYAAMRATAPVFRVSGRDAVFVTTMALVREVLSDPGTYSSRVPRQTRPPVEIEQELAALRQDRPPSMSVLVGNDPPEHTVFRRMANRAFTPRAVAGMEHQIVAIARELVDRLPDEGDFVRDFAKPLPIWTIGEILGLRRENRASIARWTAALTATVGHELDGAQWLAVERERVEFDRAIVAEIDLRRDAPGNDLLSRIVTSVDDEVDAVTDATAIALNLVRHLLVAGNETTSRVLAECVALLAQHPHEWERLRRTPRRAGAIFEEAARLTCPVQQLVRRVTRPVTLGGVELAAGTTVLISFASASRDESVFTDPDRFNPGRPELRGHLAFGHGVHACLGAGLARLEGTVALRELARGLHRMSVMPHEPRYLASYLLRGRTTLPVKTEHRHPR